MDLTVVIPVFNRKKNIKATLDSIANSGTDIRQIIIIDNNSSDGSYEYVLAIKDMYPIDIIVDKENKPGAASARNKGLQLCKTEWVYFFDSDDIFTGLPNIEGKTDDFICFPCKQYANHTLTTRAYKPVTTPHTAILNSMLNTLSMLFRTSFLQSIGGWNESCRVWDDWELGIRALFLSNKTTWITDKAYHKIIIHDDSITGSNFSDKSQEFIHTIEQVILFTLDMKDGKEKDRCLFALFLRCYILSGNLLKEKNHTASKDVHGLINKYYQVGKNDYKMGHLIEWYVSKGFRGAWKLALYIVAHTV